MHKIDIKYENICAFRIDKQLFGYAKDVLYVCVYVPPEGSPFYSHFGYDQGISILEDCLTDLLLMLDDVYIIICGDLNRRIAAFSPSQPVKSNIESQCLNFTSNLSRNSQDAHLNTYGKSLLNMCTALDLTILNGICNGDQEGRYTYASENGCSVNDYFILSSDLYDLVHDSCELRVADRIESDHFPLEFCIFCPGKNCSTTICNSNVQVIEKFAWDEVYAPEFYSKLGNTEIHDRFETAIQLIDVNVNEALNVFNDCIRRCAECMKKTIRVNHSELKNWFDAECYLNRRNVRKLLRKFRSTKDKDDKDLFVKARREYKNMLKRKKKQFNDNLLERLISSINNQKDFWNCMNKISYKKRQPWNNISMDVWFQHFKCLLDKDLPNENSSHNDNVLPEIDNEFLDRPISHDEVLFAQIGRAHV